MYLKDIPLQEAQNRLREACSQADLWGLLGSVELPLDETVNGRVLAEPVWAKISSPHYHAAAMDGFAVQAHETEKASPSTPLILEIGRQAIYVDTGDMLPDGMDAVIPIEQVESLDRGGQISVDIRRPKEIRVRAAVPPWSHVRPMGEDMVATQLVLPAGQILRPVDLGAIAASGNTSVIVARKPRIAIIPTGSELIPIGAPVTAGSIIEYNSLVLAGQVNQWGGEAMRFPIVADDLEKIKQVVANTAKEADLILLNAGSSAGSEDYSAQVVESLGRLLVHGVAVRPGHPVIIGMVTVNGETTGVNPRQIPIIGVPGYPVSAALTGEIFVRPLIERWLGLQLPPSPVIKATLTRKVTSPAGDDDYMRVAVGKVGQRIVAAPLSKGAGVITSLVRADGFVIIPKGTQGLSAGREVEVQPYRPIAEFGQTIFAIGSHDLTLDLLAQYLAGKQRRFISANVGSLGGLLALKRGEAHVAGSHLLDLQTGEYNISYIKQYLSDTPVFLIAFVDRKQGLLIKRGNPKDIHTIQDLAREDVTFINRQRGAGTRVLLDYQLGLLGILSENIQGYQQEEFTHLAVAAAVASGRADCGLGVAAAASALDLDFVPLFDERYDLVIPREFYEDDLLAPFLELMGNQAFRQEVDAMEGYNTRRMGEVIAKIG
ncbi:MAG: molybdopterin biosynthesis protein [Anaerolineales bacterium]|nr:molybdopterin biosynthesis protein [Anaerolineales bacterium]